MFGTSGIRGPVGEEITADLALDVGRAVGSQSDINLVIVGRDVRDSGGMLQDAITAGLRECGVDVLDVGVAATPTIARSVGWYDADAAITVTASHNPPEDNGFKLWDARGKAFDAERREQITETIETGGYALADWDRTGDVRRIEDASEHHRQALVEALTIAEPIEVVVDIGNGTGRVTADALRDLGCHVVTLNAQPDGHFPGRPSEPTAENLVTLSAFVADSDAAVGIAHDGDADRMMAVDETGSFITGDTLLTLFATAAVDEDNRVAAPLNTSLLVEDALNDVGATLTRTPVGDVYVAERCTEPDVVFGGEPSGAWIWPEQSLCPDGPLAACKLVTLLDENAPLSTLIEQYDAYPIRRESIRAEDKLRRMEDTREMVTDGYDNVSTMDGVRVELEDGWFLIRASGTQPLIRLTAEARDADRADELLADARSIAERSTSD